MWNYGCLRACVGIIGIISMLIGIAGIIVGAKLLGRDELSVLEIRDLIAYGFLVLGSLFFLSGLCGCYGAKAKSSCCSFFFAAIFSLLSLAVIAVGVAMLVYYDKFEDHVKGDDCFTGPLEDANKGAEHTFTYLCSAGCPCDAKYGDYPALAQLGKSSSEPYYVPGGATSASEVQKCTTYNTWKNLDSNSYVDDNIDFFESVEKEFDCSGICTKYPYYMFSGISRGTPKDNCVDSILDKVEDLAKTYGGISIAVGIVFFLFSICGYCLICHPDRKKEHSNFA
eukprot:CAMPEP_0114991558 /NCGR_PEP_ID=MMETSP0216-20121206/11441_1 /TAXON_ID=223996 /ORGANISM="Protocruzia adherens, Strain Boccale" /LENGTH=281 /DNA_ID=CAMNT_0002354903 /DNA_START=90 /DNA_END=935 /DNA_ORIENTATION=+